MKTKYLVTSLFTSVLLVGCGADEIVYGETDPDLMSCIQGTWNVHQYGEVRNNLTHTRTYHADGSYLEETIWAPETTAIGGLLSFLFSPGNSGLGYNYEVTLESGRYEIFEGLLYEESLKKATTTGDDEQATYNDAASLLASLPAEQEPGSRAQTTHCGSQYLNVGVMLPTTESPLTYETETFYSFVDGTPGNYVHDTAILYPDGSADFIQDNQKINWNEGSGDKYELWAGRYAYVSTNDGTGINFITCKDEYYEGCAEYVRRYLDRTTALISRNGNSYYSR